MFLLISAWVAVILFADCNEAFQSYSSTLLNLFILLTTSNYPDVQTPLVNDYWLAFLFFFGFLVTGLFLLMNLIFSAIYAQYLTIFRASLARDHRRREDTVMHAFALLAVPPTAQAPAEVSQRSVSWEAAPEAEDGFVTEEVWCDFFCAWARLSRALVREQCPRVRGRAIFQSVQSESHTPEGLDSGEFCALVLTLSDSDVVTRTQQNVQPLAGPKRAAAARLLRRPLVQHTISALLLLNLAALAVDTSRVVQQGVPPRTAFSLRERLTRPSLLINPCFTVLWDGELSARVWALGGLKYCWRGGGGTLLLRAELVILATTTAAEFVAFAAPASGMLWKACTLLRVARALRFWGRQKSFQMFAQSVVRILPAASMVLNAMIAVHLFYAEIGLQLFGGVLRESNGALDGTVWQKSSYWSNNFNSLASSVMVLFEQLVVNNWFVVMDAEAAVGGMWSRAYFISHYIIGVLAVANVFVAFVVEAWRQQMTQLSEGPSAGTAAQGRLRANTSGDLSGGGSQRCRFQSEAEWMRPQATLVREMFATDIQQILAENVATNSPRLAAARLRPGDYIQRTGNLEAALRANSPTRATSWRS
ncbi:unnamed protein product [Prorocentrum cordatum]|uniref:Ion transport domain-containing protein n=1 Tax=Prorocentrum cordatum TaxID=2364126 RepID=A0ABN9TAG2_9DINO|nr:unnamed protein product [Polarella glacialis]